MSMDVLKVILRYSYGTFFKFAWHAQFCSPFAGDCEQYSGLDGFIKGLLLFEP